jgi:hypothetical protein
MEDELDELLLQVTKKYFLRVKRETFARLFKFSFDQTTRLLTFSGLVVDEMEIRNILIMLYHLKHYMPTRSACILFHLEKSQFNQIFLAQVKFYSSKLKFLFNLDSRKEGNEDCARDFPDTYLVVDSTECIIQSTNRKTFSGKKKHFTVKYQTVVGAITGYIHAVHGPERGPMADCRIYRFSGLEEFLIHEDEYILADKGYLGCQRAIHPMKKSRSAITLERIPFTQEQIVRNKLISHYRIIVENVNASLKQWGILTQTYRGKLENHVLIFSLCSSLVNFSYDISLK